MLRYGFLPSDFNPMVLFLGEAEDLRRLSEVLRRFSASPAEIRFDDLDFCAPADGTAIVLKEAAGPGGMRRSGEGGVFHWTLDAAQAAEFAERVEGLAAPDRPAGAEMLGPDAPDERDGIPVKVSRGEYTDDFLLPAEPRARQGTSGGKG